MKRTDMINSKDIIRHRFELDLAHEQIAGAVGVSKSTVSNVLKRAKEAGVALVAAARSTRRGGASREALPIRWRTKGASAS